MPSSISMTPAGSTAALLYTPSQVIIMATAVLGGRIHRPRPRLNPGNTAAWITSAPWPWAFESLASRDKAVCRFTCCSADAEINRAGVVRQNGVWHTSQPLLRLIKPALLVAQHPVCLLPDQNIISIHRMMDIMLYEFILVITWNSFRGFM